MRSRAEPRRISSAAIIALLGAGCTTLGPMPGTLQLPAPPARRPSAEINAAFVPGYFLSSSVQGAPDGNGIQQLSLLLEPDHWIGVPGLIVGARSVGGGDEENYIEPFAGYRLFFDTERRFAASAALYASRVGAGSSGASYRATRGGIETGFDVRATPEDKVMELHLWVTTSLTGLSARGTYCVDAERLYAVDCSTDTENDILSARARGFYPTLACGLAFDFARHIDAVFHGGRLVLMAGGGTLPTVVSGEQRSAKTYTQTGIALSVAFGAMR